MLGSAVRRVRPIEAGGGDGQHATPGVVEELQLLRSVIENFPGGILLFDRDLKLVLCNETQRRLLDYPDALFEFGLPSLEQLFRFNAIRGEYGPGDTDDLVAERMRLAARREAHVFERTRPNGTVLQVRGVPLPGGGFLTTYIDITREKGVPARDKAAADPGLEMTAWTLFLDRFSQVLARVRRGQVAALHYVDLDHFRQFERHYGQDISQGLLRGVAYRLRNAARATDTVSRLGDDEFVILQSEVDRPSSVAKFANRLMDSIRQPFDIIGRKLVIEASIGVALVPRDGTAVEELIAKAKANLHRARSESGETPVHEVGGLPV